MQQRFRLRESKDFDHLRAVGRKVTHKLMTLSFAQNELPYNRYGFIVSKRLGKATIRNRVRRLLREAIRQEHSTLTPGMDVVIIARQPIVAQPFSVVQRTVHEVVTQAGLVEGDSTP